MRHVLALLILAWIGGCISEDRRETQDSASDPQSVAVANDNRAPAGTWSGDRLEIDLVAQPATWQPEGPQGPSLPVFAFAETGRTTSIPGPTIRVPEGSEVVIAIENRIPGNELIGLPPPNRRSLTAIVTSPELFVHGFPPGALTEEPLRVEYGQTRRLQFVADKPGTYLYWADTTGRSIGERSGLDAQLSGAIVVTPAGSDAGIDERLFVITMTDAFDDGSGALPENGYFAPAINGLSWPHTERLSATVGKPVRWRWVNGSAFEHPMHLHGFHFETVARGDGNRETAYSAEEAQEVVTEFMEPGSTFTMDWTPLRAGNWLMHCHIRDHIVPDPPRPIEARMHDVHDVAQHAAQAMAGLVMGIVVGDDPDALDLVEPARDLRLVVRERTLEDSRLVRGYALAQGDGPLPSGFETPGPPVVLTRGELTRIAIISEIVEPTTVHWHGMELQSYYDGVAGWSGSGKRLAPLVTRDQPFAAFIRPPRSGTFMYHTHMDETEQLISGLYGPLIVLEPGETLDPETDHIIVIGDAIDGDYEGTTINGKRHPDPIEIAAGTEHRLRLINITAASTVDVSLRENGKLQSWLPVAKDGAVLPGALAGERPAMLRLGTGETYDYVVRFDSTKDLVLEVDWIFATDPGHLVLEQVVSVQ